MFVGVFWSAFYFAKVKTDTLKKAELAFGQSRVSTRNLDSKTAKTGREKVSDSKCNLVKIENLYRNYFTQVLLTGAEQIQDSHVPQQDRV